MIIESLQNPDKKLRMLKHIRRLIVSEYDDYFKLDQVTQLLCQVMKVDSCSIYATNDESIFLLAAYGNAGKFSCTKKKWHVSEGLVSDVIRSRVLKQIFLDKDQTGIFLKSIFPERAFKTFLGIPIIRQGKVMGVLVLKTREKRLFPESEIEFLELVSFVTNSIVKGVIKKRIEKPLNMKSADGEKQALNFFKGEVFAGGRSAYGRAVLYGAGTPSFKPLSSVTQKEGLKEFYQVVEELQESIKELKEGWIHKNKSVVSSGQVRDSEDIFNTYGMLLKDPGWIKRVEGYIKKGFSSSAAVLNVQQDMDLQFSKNSNKSSAWVIEDLADITQKLVFLLQNMELTGKKIQRGEDVIIVAKTLGPGDILALKDYNIKGFVLEEGGPSSHVVLLAQSLGIPALCWVEKVTKEIKDIDYILLDIDKKAAILNPTEKYILEVEKQANSSEEKTIHPTRELQVKCQEKGYDVLVNIGLLEEMEQIQSLHIDGVGLMRTEILFMQAPDFPSVSEQERDYGNIIQALKGRRCCIRTLDIGSDKKLPYVTFAFEENPALGWRSIRRSLDKTTVLKHQLRALIRAAARQGAVDIIFPFISTPEEFFACKRVYEKELDRANLACEPPIRLGVMIEVPSIVEDLERLEGVVDFLSIGTNDLYQFFFACDRNNPNTSFRYSSLNYSFLKMLKNIYEKAKLMNVDISICGDMASQDQGIEALVALGYKKFSVVPFRAGLIQKKLSEMDIDDLKKKMDLFLEQRKNSSFSENLL